MPEKPPAAGDDSRNNWFLALLALGKRLS